MESFNNLSRSIKGRVALITGAASGMGKATAQVFAAEGARVIVTDVNEGEAKNVSEQIESDGGEALAMTLDITDEDMRIMTNRASFADGKVPTKYECLICQQLFF